MNQLVVEDVALFFDFENISISLWKQGGPKLSFKKISTWFSRFGRLVVAKAYADWASHPKFLAPLQANDFDPIFVKTHVGGGRTAVKNASDMQMVVDATAVSYTHPHIDTFGLLTGDSDFLPLVDHLRGMGKQVVVLAVEDCASVQLKNGVDLFVTYRDMLAEVDGRCQEVAQKLDPAFVMLIDALNQLKLAGKEPVLARVKTQMDNNIKDGSFNYKNYKRSDGTHCGKYISFVREAERNGIVRLVQRDNDFIVELIEKVQRKPPGNSRPFSNWSASGMPLN